MPRLNIHHLRKLLNRICRQLDEEYYINSGGCCYVAYIIALNLDRLKIKYSLVIYDEYSRETSCLNHEILSKHKNHSSNSVVGYYTCSHYCLNIIGYGDVNRSDVDGLIRYNVDNINSSNIKWIHRNGDWNSVYNSTHNKAVKRIINSCFECYGKGNISSH